MEADFVVFIIGARVNSNWQLFRSLLDLAARPRCSTSLAGAGGLGKASGLVPVAESVGARHR